MSHPNDVLAAFRRRSIVRRRVLTGAVIGVLTVAGACSTPLVVNALSYQTLTSEHEAAYAQLPEAQQKVMDATARFEKAAQSALTAREDIRVFISEIDPALLADRDALDQLGKLRDTLATDASVHKEFFTSGKDVVYTDYATPRLPGKEAPVTAEGLARSLAHYQHVYGDYTTAADRITGLAENLEANVKRASGLYEKVLDAAARYAGSEQVLQYTKADELAKHHFTTVVDDLDNTDIDPATRFHSFEEALAALAKSHADTLAAEEAERLAKIAEEEARKKAEAEEKARLEQLRDAERAANEAAERAKAEADRLEEERRKLEEAQDDEPAEEPGAEPGDEEAPG